METDIHQKIRAYITNFLTGACAPQQVNNHIKHTEAVAQAAEEIGRGNLLDEKELEIVVLAAWLYDIGCYLPQEEQEKTIQKAMDFLSNQGVSSQVRKGVIRCIKAMHVSSIPANVLEATLLDAQTCYIASDHYFEQAPLLRKALNGKQGKDISEQKWLNDTIHFFNQHVFFTEYAKYTFTAGKENNLNLLNEKLQKLNNSQEVVEKLTRENKKLKRKLEKNKGQKTSRGIETIFRTTLASHLQLSAMADNKANLMISVNAIIVSIMVASFVRKFDEIPNLLVPTMLLTIVCLLTIVFAVLSTRPTINQKKKDHETSDNNRVDLLFFGDFTKLSVNRYKEGFKNMMHNDELLYGSMIDNIYSQGKVLNKKYQLLKIAYTIFMVGFVVVVLSYIIALLFFPAAS